MTIKVAAEYVRSLGKPEPEPCCPRETCEGVMEPMSQTWRQMQNGTFRLMRCQICNHRRWYRETRAWALLPEDLEF